MRTGIALAQSPAWMLCHVGTAPMDEETTMKKLMMRLLRDSDGQDLIEYALLGGFISLAAAAGATALGTALDTWYDDISTTVGGLPTG
jgi:pilus assembly protein Flp/PilA